MNLTVCSRQTSVSLSVLNKTFWLHELLQGPPFCGGLMEFNYGMSKK